VTRFLRFKELTELSPPDLDGHRYRLSYDIGEVRGESFVPLDTRQVMINTSGTLQAVWRQSDSQVAETSSTAAASIITDVASRGALNELQTIELNTFTAPKVPPKEPLFVPNALIPIPDLPAPPPSQPKFSIISDDIAELRDQINAISGTVLNGRLLELPQERAILDIYKPAGSPEEFRNRVQSLAGICIALNKKLLGAVLGRDNASIADTGSILLLEEYLSTIAGSQEATTICAVLKNVNELRKGFPTHGDNTDKFLAAHDFFKIPYPIENFSSAWDTVLGAYFRAMKQLRDILARHRTQS